MIWMYLLNIHVAHRFCACEAMLSVTLTLRKLKFNRLFRLTSFLRDLFWLCRGSAHVQGSRGKESHPSSMAREHQRLGHAELLSCHCRPVLLSPAGGVRPGCSWSLVPVLLWGCAGTAGRDRQWARQWHSWPPLQHFPPTG